MSGQWYKGNTHLHSTASDGGQTFPELSARYRQAGYDFLFRTDHWVLSDVSKDEVQHPLLWLDGVELDGKDHTGAGFHVVCLGQVQGVRREDGFEAALRTAMQQNALTILAHPHWCGNSLEDALRWPFDGVEVYNHVCRWLNGKGDGLVHWTETLKSRPNTLAFAVDDSHLTPAHPGWNGGWIMVRAADRSAPSLLQAIRRGHFYSTCGPEILSIAVDGDALRVETSPVRFVRLVGPAHMGRRVGAFEGPLLTETRIPFPVKWDYAYLEIEDQQGRRAWTNNLFVPDAVQGAQETPAPGTGATQRGSSCARNPQ
jgi:hypothetical protein